MKIFHKIKQYISGIFFLGISRDTPFQEVAKTFMYNLFCFMALPFITFFMVVNFFNTRYHLLLLNIILFVLYAFALWVNIRRMFLWIRPLIVILVSVTFIFGAVAYNNGTEYNLLMTLMCAVIIFDRNLNFFLYSVVVIAALTYIWNRTVSNASLNNITIINHYTNVFLSQILFVFSIYAFKYIYFKYQKELQAAYEGLKESESRRDKILQVVAHDLRNPVGAISSFLEIVQVKYQHSEAENKILQSVNKAAADSLNLINELLEVNEIRTGYLLLNRKELDINLLTEQAIEQVQHKAAAKQQTILLQKTGAPLFVSADTEKLSRVLLNLLDNASKFSYAGTEILVTITQQDKQALIKVADKGIGIPVSLQEQLFHSNQAVRRVGTNNEKSNGLGLAICKQIIEAHGGLLTVETEEGKGSVFTVILTAA